MFGWNFTSRYILINPKLLLLPCWNIQNLLYNYVNSVFCILPASLNSLFFSINPLKLHAFTSKLLLNMISMSVQTLNSPFLALNAHRYNHLCLNHGSCKLLVLWPTWFIILCLFHCSWLLFSQEQSKPDHLHYLHLQSFQAGLVRLLSFLRNKICSRLIY